MSVKKKHAVTNNQNKKKIHTTHKHIFHDLHFSWMEPKTKHTHTHKKAMCLCCVCILRIGETSDQSLVELLSLSVFFCGIECKQNLFF